MRQSRIDRNAKRNAYRNRPDNYRLQHGDASGVGVSVRGTLSQIVSERFNVRTNKNRNVAHRASEEV